MNTTEMLEDTEFFNGVVVVGHKGLASINDTNVAVYSAGAVINHKNPRNVIWSTDDGRNTTKELDYDVRHYFVGDRDLMSKSEIKKLTNIKKFQSGNSGAKLYQKTPIGPVLYITVENDSNYFYDCIEKGMIDVRTRINIEKRRA